jgi:hypothetical protein
MGQQRSNGVTRVRREAGAAIFECLEKEIHNPTLRGPKFRELIGWTETADRKGEYLALAPILYDNYQGEHNHDTIFLNKILFRV